MTETIRSEPSVLPLWRRLGAGWRRVGRTVGDFQARALLTLFYFVILGPFALALRAFADPLSLKARTPRGWRARPAGDPASPSRAMRQS